MIIRTIDQLIEGRSLISVAPGARLRAACSILNSHNVGALAVLENGALKGVLSERDVIRRGLVRPGSLDDLCVADIMTADPVTIRRGAGLVDAMTLMREGGFRHLPVLDAAGLPVGMLSLRDIPTEYRLMTERYQEYMTGKVPA